MSTKNLSKSSTSMRRQWKKAFKKPMSKKFISLERPSHSLRGEILQCQYRGSFKELKSSDVHPHMVFHYGIPSGSTKFAYDSIQEILIVSTKDGRLKLFGKENYQAVLESGEIGPSKFLQFLENQGIVLNVTPKNQIQVWNIKMKTLSCKCIVNEDITAFTAFADTPNCSYMYVGDSAGNISILQHNLDRCIISQMKYSIPFAVSHGNASNAAVTQILPQPMAKSERILIIYEDGKITLWEIRISKSIFSTGQNVLQSLTNDRKKVTSASWACPMGSQVAVGYSSGDIFIWSIPTQNRNTKLATDSRTQIPFHKLNLGYRLQKTPITLLKWVYADGKASRLYIVGASDDTSISSLQVVLLHEHMKSCTVKMVAQLPEPCITVEIISTSTRRNIPKNGTLLVLGKSGSIYAYDDGLIEKYLLQTQSRFAAVRPEEIKIKVPLPDSSITVAQFVVNNPDPRMTDEERYIELARKYPSLLLSDKNAKDGIKPYVNSFGGLSKIRNLFVTGHSNGDVNFWDISCPLLFPLVSLKPQVAGDSPLGSLAISALYFEARSRLLVFGNKSESVHICKLKADSHISGSVKRGNIHVIESAKDIMIPGEVRSISISPSSSHLAVGSDQGHVSLIEMEGHQGAKKMFTASEGILSLQFGTCFLHGIEKNILVIATINSTLLALDCDTGNPTSNSLVPKKPSKALYMEIFDDQSSLSGRPKTLSNSNISKAKDALLKKKMLLLCSEKAAYVYSLPDLVQCKKKVLHKEKFPSSSCCWASTFYAPYIGLILIFADGKLETRSLPKLSLLKEGIIKGFVNSNANSSTTSAYSICSSQDGQLLMVNGDQEILAFSVVPRNPYRLLDHFGQVYRRDQEPPQEGLASAICKEKKKGQFSFAFKSTKRRREKHMPDVDREVPSGSIQPLSMIFSAVNFPANAVDGDRIKQDDTDINGIGEKPRGRNMLPGASVKKRARKLRNIICKIAGKMMQIKVKNKKSVPKEESQDEKMSSVDQVKSKYGRGSYEGIGSAVETGNIKLRDNLRKLQEIKNSATLLEDAAESYSSNANELLQKAKRFPDSILSL